MPGCGDQVAARLHLRLADGQVVAGGQLQATASGDAGAHRGLTVGIGDQSQRQVVADLKGGINPASNRLIASALAKRSSICHLRF